MASNRYRNIDSWHFAPLNNIDATNAAADELIDQPEKHLLTQD